MRHVPFFFSCCLGLASCALSASPSIQHISLCLDDVDVYPWHMQNNTGLSVLMIEQVGKQLEINFILQRMPWRRCLAMVQTGQIQGAIGASFLPARQEQAVYPAHNGTQPDVRRRMSTTRYYLYRLKGGQLRWNGQQISDDARPVGVQLGYSIADNLRALGREVDESEKEPEQLLRKLYLGKLSAVALVESVGSELLNKPEYADKIMRLGPALARKEYYLVFSQQFVFKNKALAEKIWDTVASVRTSTAYQQQLRSFGISDD